MPDYDGKAFKEMFEPMMEALDATMTENLAQES